MSLSNAVTDYAVQRAVGLLSARYELRGRRPSAGRDRPARTRRSAIPGVMATRPRASLEMTFDHRPCDVLGDLCRGRVGHSLSGTSSHWRSAPSRANGRAADRDRMWTSIARSLPSALLIGGRRDESPGLMRRRSWRLTTAHGKIRGKTRSPGLGVTRLDRQTLGGVELCSTVGSANLAWACPRAGCCAVCGADA